MQLALGFAFLFAFVALYVGVVRSYGSLLRAGIRKRLLVTDLEDWEIAEVFRLHVATGGWKLVHEGHLTVAQSPLIAGRRQQLAIEIEELEDDPGKNRVLIGVVRHTVNDNGNPAKAHTLRIRIKRFIRGMQVADPSTEVYEDVVR